MNRQATFLVLLLFLGCGPLVGLYYWTSVPAPPPRTPLRTECRPTEYLPGADPFLDEEERALHESFMVGVREQLAEHRRLAEPYFFVHIAKTGGSSLYKSIKGYARGVLFSHFWIHENIPVKEVINQEVPEDKVHVIGGHLCYGIHRWWASHGKPLSRYTYFTFLRDPVKRVMSHYRYHLNPKDVNHRLTARRTFMEWVRDVSYGQNVMTGYMAGIDHYAWWNKGEVPLKPTSSPLFPNTIITEEQYLIARRNLITSVVGIQEEFHQSIDLLNRLFGLELATGVRENVGSVNSYEFSEEERALIIQLNHWDLELYKLGVYLYRQLQEISAEF